MTMAKAALAAKGEEIVAAAWTGFWSQDPDTPGVKQVGNSPDAIETSDVYSRHLVKDLKEPAIRMSEVYSKPVYFHDYPVGELALHASLYGRFWVVTDGFLSNDTTFRVK
jgi:hypothetical protein